MRENFITLEHQQEHQAKIEASFANDPFSRFMRDLRHYITHHAVPIVQMSYHVTEQAKTHELNIDLEQANSWKGWSSKAKEFLDLHQPAIRMLALVNDYEEKANAFHEDFVRTFFKYYYQEVREHLAFQGELEKVLSQTNTDRENPPQ
jgi:hypothetical protein